ncbi:unnamed protein product [Symbiodinium sp. KB8]|nr:unnamed protein product [Symbiodinium sp. KB8]
MLTNTLRKFTVAKNAALDKRITPAALNTTELEADFSDGELDVDSADLVDVSPPLEYAAATIGADISLPQSAVDAGLPAPFLQKDEVRASAPVPQLLKGGQASPVMGKAWHEFVRLPGTAEAFAYNLTMINNVVEEEFKSSLVSYRFAMVVTMAAYLGLTPYVFATGGKAADRMCKENKIEQKGRSKPMSKLKIFSDAARAEESDELAGFRLQYLISDAIVFLNRWATLGNRVHVLGLMATPKSAGKVAAGTGEGPSRYDGLLARAWSVIGLDPDKSGVLPQLYALSKMLNFVGNTQTRFAAFDTTDGTPRDSSYEKLTSIVKSLNDQKDGANRVSSAYVDLLYKAPVIVHCSHRNELCWVRMDKNECPRAQRGPSGMKSYLDAVCEARLLVLEGATLLCPNLQVPIRILTAGASLAFPLAHLFCGGMLSFLRKSNYSVVNFLESSEVGRAREQIKPIRAFYIGWVLGKTGAGPQARPGDDEAVRQQPFFHQTAQTLGSNFRATSVSPGVIQRVASVAMGSTPAVTEDMSSEDVQKVWDEHIASNSFTPLSDPVRSSLESLRPTSSINAGGIEKDGSPVDLSQAPRMDRKRLSEAAGFTEPQKKLQRTPGRAPSDTPHAKKQFLQKLQTYGSESVVELFIDKMMSIQMEGEPTRSAMSINKPQQVFIRGEEEMVELVYLIVALKVDSANSGQWGPDDEFTAFLDKAFPKIRAINSDIREVDLNEIKDLIQCVIYKDDQPTDKIVWALTADTRESTDEQGNKVTVPDIAKMVEAWTNPTMEVLTNIKHFAMFSFVVECDGAKRNGLLGTSGIEYLFTSLDSALETYAKVAQKHGPTKIPTFLACLGGSEEEDCQRILACIAALRNPGTAALKAVRLLRGAFCQVFSGRPLEEVAEWLAATLLPGQASLASLLQGRKDPMASTSIEECFPSMMHYLFRYGRSYEELLLAQTNVGGENVHRGALLGALAGAAAEFRELPSAWCTGLADVKVIEAEVESFVGAVCSVAGPPTAADAA